MHDHKKPRNIFIYLPQNLKKQLMSDSKNITGGDFLIKEVTASEIFIPEEFNEEQKMITQTCDDFLESEVFPMLDRIDKQELGLMPKLLAKAGELGLLAISIPEEYDGFGQSFITAMRANESLGAGYSFTVAYSAHVGIGTMPIVYYGNEAQKRKYLPKLATGEWIAAYCLTEPNAGSDANSGRTKATLTDDGRHYVLNGQKMWITNGGFADVLTVFAKIDNDRVLSAFIVDSNLPGISMNPEEHKMGIKGSSTRQIFFNDVKVPVENLLGNRGEGFRIALNILQMGRIKLGGIVLGAAKRAINQSVSYANERKQFGSLISNFGAIKQKLAEQVIRTFTNESAVYRTSMNIEEAAKANLEAGLEKGKAEIEAIAKFSVECAMLKVYGSEALDFVVDEAVQIYGGMGFSAEAPVDRAYRDSRINRIFEGTNEINRLLAADTAIKKAQKGEFDLFGKAKAIFDSLDSLEETDPEFSNYYEEKAHYMQNFKKAILLVIYAFSERYRKNLINEQEIMMNIADMMMQLYAAESTMLRIDKMQKFFDEKHLHIYQDILDVFTYDAAARISKAGKDAINSTEEGDQVKKLNRAIENFTRVAPVDIKEARRRIADRLIYDTRYTF
jgi:alkylation response protein AidB-like acyl-CoA dehydrogenase